MFILAMRLRAASGKLKEVETLAPPSPITEKRLQAMQLGKKAIEQESIDGEQTADADAHER